MLKTFNQYVKLREDDAMGAGVNGSIGGDAQATGTAGDLGAAFKDLASSIVHALSGHSGPKILNTIITAVLRDPQVPNRVKEEIKQKISRKWSHVVDLSDSPEGEGPGLGNIPGPGPYDPSMNNVIVPNQADNMGIGN